MRRSSSAYLASCSSARVNAASASTKTRRSSSPLGSFAISYAVEIGHERSTVLAALSAAWAGAIVTTPVYGRLSDRFGRRPVYLFGALAFALLSFPTLDQVIAFCGEKIGDEDVQGLLGMVDRRLLLTVITTVPRDTPCSNMRPPRRAARSDSSPKLISRRTPSRERAKRAALEGETAPTTSVAKFTR